jgi:hypothetical protein
MSTKTTFKRIALVAVAALGFGVLSVVPSQADVSGLIITPTDGTATVLKSDSSTAASLNIQGFAIDTSDSLTVTLVAAAALPDGGNLNNMRVFFTDSSTSVAAPPTVETASAPAITQNAAGFKYVGAITVKAPATANTTSSVKFKITLGETTTNSVVAGVYSLNAVVKSTQAGVFVTNVVPFKITVAAAPVAAAKVPAAANAKAYIQQVSSWPSGTVLADSATSGVLTAGETAGMIRITNADTLDAAASDTMTVAMTGVGYIVSGGVSGRSFIIAPATSADLTIKADGSSGVGTITITTAAGASFVKTVTFFDKKPAKAVATVAKAFIKAGTAEVAKVFSVVVTDAAGNAVTDSVITAAATDTATTVGGAASCGTYNTTDKVYYCAVKGLSATKFGPVAYTITATGSDAAKTKVTTSATTTFSDVVATKAVLAGPASGAPGATVEYTITLTDKNGYAVADEIYGAGVEATGGDIFAKAVVSGWTTAPFAATESWTSVSGVITSKGILPIAGVATGTWTLAGDGLQTLTGDAIDKTIGKTTLTVSTDVANPGVDAATDAANEATDAANAATDAALAAAEAADAATTAAQEASDAVAALSESVTKLIAGLQAQIKSLAAVVAKIAKKVKA